MDHLPQFMRVCTERFPETNGFYLHPWTKQNLDHANKYREERFDVVALFCGDEGTGKTTLAQQFCTYMYPAFNLDCFAWTPEVFAQKLTNAPEGSAILFDEARTGCNRKRTMSRINQIINDKFTVIRKKRLFIALCVPDFFEVDSFVAERRARFMVNTIEERTHRGIYDFYSRKRMRLLSIYGRKYKNMNAAGSNFKGNFHNFWTVPEREYDKLKDQAIATIGNFETLTPVDIEKLYKQKMRDMIANIDTARVTAKGKLDIETLAKVVGVSSDSIKLWKSNLIKKQKVPQETQVAIPTVPMELI